MRHEFCYYDVEITTSGVCHIWICQVCGVEINVKLNDEAMFALNDGELYSAVLKKNEIDENCDIELAKKVHEL